MEPKLTEIFTSLKTFLRPYESSFEVAIDTDNRYELWTSKEMVLSGNKGKKIYFAGGIIQKGYVGFYYMPVYVENTIKDFLKPEFVSLLKGKSCFHIKEMNNSIKQQIEAALKIGYGLYKDKGWI